MVVLYIVGIDYDWFFCLWAVVHTSDLSTFLFGVIALVYTLRLRHFCWCYCCHLLIDCHQVVALYSFDQKFVWLWWIILLFLWRRPFVFIVILFSSWSRRRCHRCGPIDRCFRSHRRVVFVAYTPTPRSIEKPLKFLESGFRGFKPKNHSLPILIRTKKHHPCPSKSYDEKKPELFSCLRDFYR